MKIEFKASKDGSHTLFLPELNETYHSLHGAITESEYVFINEGLRKVSEQKNEITIFEIGFGTGLNALLSLIFAKKESKKIFYHTLEPFPIPKEIFENLNYIDLLHCSEFKEAFLEMHNSEDEKNIQINDRFNFCRYKTTLENFSNSKLHADVIFYDAFAPSKQPEVWSLNNLLKVKSLMNQDALLVTYCASGQFKRDLKEAGFTVEPLPGPPGKKEMTRAFIS